MDLHLLVLTGFEFCLCPAYSYTIFKLLVRHLIFDFQIPYLIFIQYVIVYGPQWSVQYDESLL